MPSSSWRPRLSADVRQLHGQGGVIHSRPCPSSLAMCAVTVTLILPSALGAQAMDTLGLAAQVLAFEDARFAAMTRADTAWLHDALAEELTYVHTTARTETKAQFLAAIGSGAIRYWLLAPTERRVRLLGSNAAAVSGLARVRVDSGGERREFAIRYLSVYRHSGGRWQLLAWQSTRLPEPGP